MASGIEGTGPYSRLRQLRWDASCCKYEIEMKSPGPRKLKDLQRQAAAIKADIKTLTAQIRAGNSIKE